MVITPRHVYQTLDELAEVLRCVRTAVYAYLEPAGQRDWRLRPLDEDAYRDWHRRHYAAPAVRQGRRGTPVYDEQGVLFAISLAEAARRLKVVLGGLRGHLRPYADGYQLISRPNPANVGRRGGAKLRRVLPR